MSKLPWPGVKRVKAKGRVYWYWTRSEVRVRLPDPYTDTDAFMRKMAHLGRVAAAGRQSRGGTFGALAATFRTMPAFTNLRPNTRRSYGRYLDRLIVAYGDAPVREITREDVQTRVMDANADTPAAANMMLHAMRAVFKFACKRIAGLKDPTAEIEVYAAKGEHEPWPDHILASALTSEDLHFRRAVALHYYTGQRTGDACAMAWNAISGNAISVKQEKTNEPLKLDMLAELHAELAATPRVAIVILTNRRGGPLTPGTFYKWCVQFSAKHGLRRTAHGLRKNAVNALIEAGCDAFEVMSVTGHRSLAMVQHYANKRNQPKINLVATGKWAASTKREREN